MALTLDETGRFTSNGKPLGITATQKRGRWQYRMDSGDLVASGMKPGAFAKKFWYRDDFEEGV